MKENDRAGKCGLYCGAPFDWYAKTCHQCGEPVFNCVAEDQQKKK